MATFTREGKFRDRARFLDALRRKLEKLRDGALRGSSLAWSEDGPASRATLSGFGASVVFTVRDAAWSCEAELPAWLPVPPSMIEKKFDDAFAELKDL